MKQIKSTLALIAGLALCLSVSVSTQAATIIQDQEYAQGPLLFSLSQFDPGLGVLNSVTLDLVATYDRQVTAVKTGNGSATGVWTFPYTITVSSGVQTLGTLSGNSPVSQTVTLANKNQTSTLTAEGATINNGFVFADDLSPFIGSNAMSLLFSVDFSDQISKTSGQGGFNCNPLSSVFKNGTVTATYNYTPAPLPSALIFLISGLAAVVGFKRFKAARA